jgi:hypothetical protein
MRKLVERIILFVLGALSAAGILFLSCPSIDPIETTNKWFKVATDEANPEIVALDMNRGYSYTDGPYILIVVQDSENKDEIVIAFPNGGYWTAPVLNPELNKSTAWEKRY